MKRSKRALALYVSGSLVLASVQGGCVSEASQPDTQSPVAAAPQASDETAQVVTQQSPAELDELVAPIALYPDALVAQILAAATYPTEVVEADRWIQQHPDLKGDTLAQAVDPQSWDPSVKALTQFPSVLGTMDRNLPWTSSLGDAYVNDPQNVLDAVQMMRQRAQQVGSLKSTQQETVTTQGQTIVIEPADPEVVYVPEYDPWVVYGAPLSFYPGWVGVPGAFIDGPGMRFGLGIGVGVFAGFGWGWHHWGTDWHGHDVTHDHDRYISHSPTFITRSHFEHGHPLVAHPGGFIHGGDFQHGGGFPRAGGFPQPTGLIPGGGLARSPPSGIHSGPFSGFNHGGVTNAFSSRGSASFGGGSHGGGSHGGGGFHGGGGGHR